MKIYESAEDYLERILMLSMEKENVRAIDIAHSLNFSKPSVSIAMKKLAENNLIYFDNNYIKLTENGLELAKRVYDRHETLTKALIRLGVSEDIAREDACKIEHDLSEESFLAIKNHINKF